MLNSHRATSRKHAPPAAVKPELPKVLAALAAGGPLTAAGLAAATRLARATVWREVGRLRQAGVAIERGADGYRLAVPVETLDPAAIRARLPDPVRARVGRIENHWRLDSTSSECTRRAPDLPDCSFIFAEWQAAGRGRRGHRWYSPPGAGVQVSCLKRFEGGCARLAGLSLAAGVALVDALTDCGVAGVGLKWPNDLVVGGAKLGGVLVELGGDVTGSCFAVIGIGINVALPERVRGALGRAVTDLAELAGDRAPARERVAAALIARLVPALDAFARDGFPAFAGAWGAHDALAGRDVRVAGGREVFDGVAAGVDGRGALRVRQGRRMRLVEAAEVSVRAR